MALYRCDSSRTNDHGQQSWYAEWVGGPTLAKAQAICPDGLTRTAYVTGEPDTWFSQPAYVNNGGAGRVRGYLTTDEHGRWEFRPYRYLPNNPAAWRPTRASLSTATRQPTT